MSAVALILGPVAFRDFEIPERICFGGRQRLVLHSLLGGSRIIDSLGRDDTRIEFQGTFSGTDATARARELDELRVVGQPLPLTWDVFFYTVFLDDFEANYENACWIPFRISCTVLRDEAAAPIAIVGSLAESLLADLGSASAAASNMGYDLMPLQAALSAPNVSIFGSSDYVAAQTSLSTALGSMTVGRDGIGATLDTNPLGEASTADAASTALNGAIEAAGQAANLATAKAYLGRAAVTFRNAGT